MKINFIKITEKKIKKILIKRKKNTYKNDFGHTYVFAGNSDYVGAAFFSSEACVRAGSGLVTLFTDVEILDIMKTKLNEVMVKDISKKINFNKSNALVFGCGMGNNIKTFNFLKKLEEIQLPLVLDADGINALTFKKDFYKSFLKKRQEKTILTPHYGEFSKLISEKNILNIKKNRFLIAKKFAKKHKVILILKDHKTLVTDGKKIYLNTTGNSSMSNAGMGDILAGMIGSFISQGYSPLKASILGVFLHGKCGDNLSKKNLIVNPRDILKNLPKLENFK
ncbi:MAG: NAD(P)H-hydrate dehydratase [Fusobacteriaceae bacterium]